MNQYNTYTGTFTKRNGQSRTMTFVKSTDIPSHVQGSGTAPRLSKGEEVVWDINVKGFRVFNHNTVQGTISESKQSVSFS